MKQSATQLTLKMILINFLLTAFKLTAGILSHSNAMISDAVHSASDVFSSLVVILGIHISSKESDTQHPYGHERFECVAAILLSCILAGTGFMIGQDAFHSLFLKKDELLLEPGQLALFAALVSIVVKEGMYWFTRNAALKLDSSALMADAWHHRSDALSSIGALIGIAGARLGFPLCDPIASLIICFFILKAAFDIFKDATYKMVDHSCDKETELVLKACILAHPGVLKIDFFQTRMFGNKIYVDLEISVNASSSLTEAHDIAEQIHHMIESSFSKVKHIMIHVNPHSSEDS